MNIRRVALYARYSCEMQNPTSASDQIDAMRERIARDHPEWVVVAEDRDEAVSGTSVVGRAGLNRLCERARAYPPPFDAIVVEDQTRFARNRADSMRVRDELSNYEVVVLSVSTGFMDPNSRLGRMVTGFNEIVAEDASVETADRVRRGVRARTRLGWLSGRRVPFGYQRKPVFSEVEKDPDGKLKRLGVQLERNPLEAPAVRHMFKRRAAGVGYRRLAREMNGSPRFSAVKSEPYTESFIRSLLLNPAYLGWIVYGRTSEKNLRIGDEQVCRKKRLPPEEWAVCTGAHEALVDQETWDVVQAQFAANKGKGIGGPGRPIRGGRRRASILTSRVKCGTCSKSFVIWTSGRNSRQRRAGTGRSQRRFCCTRARSSGGDLCGNRVTVEAARLERSVLDSIEGQVLTPAGIEYLERQRRRHVEAELRSRSGEADALQREWNRIEKEQGRLIEAIKSGVPLPGLAEEAARLDEERRAIRGEVERIGQMETLLDRSVDEHLRRNRVSHLRDVLGAPDRDAVWKALGQVIEGVEAREDGSFWLKVGEGPLGTEDLCLIQSNDSEGEEEVPSASATSAEDAGGRGPRGLPPTSRICVVGASRVVPFKRPVLWRLRVAV